MYIEKLIIHNFGAIDRFELDKFDLLNHDENPKPIILVGKNGSGKTTLLSSIADSFFEIAKSSGFDDVLPQNGAGYSYFKMSGGINQKLETSYGLCYLKYTNDIQYINKSGILTLQQYKEYTNESNPFTEGFTEHKNIKLSNTHRLNTESLIQNHIQQNTYLYFPSDRFEYPHWMTDNFITENFDDREIYDNNLGKKILIRDNLKNIKIWIKDIVLDSRAELTIIEPTGSAHYSDQRPIQHIKMLKQSKNNIEQILSAILEQQVTIKLGIRSEGNNRISIQDVNRNIIVPSLESLSAGQSTLLSIFCSIIQASDINDVNKSIDLSKIEGIVLIDEIDLHLHIKLQKDVLPNLIKLFPKVQFIISSHSPFFLKGMHDVFGDDVLMVNMPECTKLTNFSEFSEFDTAFNVFDSIAVEYKNELRQLTSKMSEMQKPLIITEGKTDWKHLKAALIRFKSEGHFTSLDIDFLEYEDSIDKGSSGLEILLKSAKTMNSNKIIIGIFDRDEPAVIQKYPNITNISNKVFAFCLPEPQHRTQYKNISIEFYYTDEEIKTQLSTGSRLYFDNEYREINIKNPVTKKSEQIYEISETPRAEDEFDKKIFEDNLHKTLNKGKESPPAHSKEIFANHILNGEFLNKFNKEHFSLIFTKIEEIIQQDQQS
ncbi:MAG: AAA family ATPase [Burkholderiales bacterium]|nr:AAA family ATPase [Burkholderiales bacterium]